MTQASGRQEEALGVQGPRRRLGRCKQAPRVGSRGQRAVPQGLPAGATQVWAPRRAGGVGALSCSQERVGEGAGAGAGRGRRAQRPLRRRGSGRAGGGRARGAAGARRNGNARRRGLRARVREPCGGRGAARRPSHAGRSGPGSPGPPRPPPRPPAPTAHGGPRARPGAGAGRRRGSRRPNGGRSRRLGRRRRAPESRRRSRRCPRLRPRRPRRPSWTWASSGSAGRRSRSGRGSASRAPPSCCWTPSECGAAGPAPVTSPRRPSRAPAGQRPPRSASAARQGGGLPAKRVVPALRSPSRFCVCARVFGERLGWGGRAGVRGAGTVRSRPGGRWPLLLRAPCAEPGGGEERAGRPGSEPPRAPEGRGSASPGFAAAG